MMPLAWLVAAAVVPWLVLRIAAGAWAHPEVLYGMLGPLAASVATWIAVARTFRSSPERLTAVMIAGLLIKAVFFGVYVVVMVRVLELRLTPFMLSFTGYFIGLYGLEALFLKRLFAGAVGASR